MSLLKDLKGLPVDDIRVRSQISHHYNQLLTALDTWNLSRHGKAYRDAMADAVMHILYLDRGTCIYRKEVACAERARQLLQTVQRIPVITRWHLTAPLFDPVPLLPLPAPLPSPDLLPTLPTSSDPAPTPAGNSSAPISPPLPPRPSTPPPAALPTNLTAPSVRPAVLSAKTRYEMRKGRELDDDKVGVAVPTACKNCAGLQANYLKKPDGRDPPHPCRVAIDPLSFRSVKCGNCIASKRECCFKWDNPGIEYPPEKIQALQRIEEHKIAGRKAARQTVQKRKRPSEE